MNIFDKLETWWKEKWNKFKETIGIGDKPTTDPANPDNPTQPSLPAGENLSDEEAQKIIPTLQYMEGCQSSDPNVLRLVKMYGRRITHFGGGNKPNQPKDETYLWKPESDNDGKLVVITPSSTYIKSCTVGSEIKTSLSIGNGWRPHFRFSKSGVNGYGSSPVVTANPSGSAKISTPSKKQSFKVSGSTVVTNPQPDVPVVNSNPRYSPGFVEVPADFLNHGSIKELRYGTFSVAKGQMKPVAGSKTQYTIPMPTDPAWAWNAPGTAFGTKAKFSDGSVFDGYVHDRTGSYPMPLQQKGKTQGRAFWVKM